MQREFARKDLGADRLEMIDAGDRVVVGLAGSRFREVPGSPIDGEIYVVYTLREGRTVRMDDFLGRSEAMEAALKQPAVPTSQGT